MTRAGKISLALAFAAAVGCNLILGNEPGKPFVEAGADANADAPADVAEEPHHTCDGGSANDASMIACPGNVWYVSASLGDDAFDGCTPCAPKASIQAALDAIDATQPDAGAVAVHVCAGTYPEVGLTLDRPVSVEGGYDCSAWTRPSDYGFPNFGTTTTTTIVNGNPLSDATTMSITTGATAGTLIDGFTIEGASVTSNATSGISIDGDAAPIVSNCKIAGGSGHDPASSLGSMGIVVGDVASPEITSNEIDGGSGFSPGSTGSAGVALLFGGGIPHIHGNHISGGSGSGSYASAGVFASATTNALTRANNAAIENNIIHGGSGGTGVNEGSTGVFVYASTATIEIDGNTIDGGSSNASGNDLDVGVYVFDAALVTMTQNRIAGGGTIALGDGGTAPTFSGSATTGVYLANTTALITNNFIHGGYSSSNTDGVVIGASAATLLYNTIFAGGSAGQFSPSIYVGGGTSVIRGNLLVGYAEAGAAAIYEAKTCSDNVADAITDFTDNAIINSAGGVILYQTCPSITNLAAAEAYLNTAPDPSTTASGNVLLLETCTGDTRCVQTAGCTLAAGSDAACIDNLLSSYDASNVGQTELFGSGYMLKPTAHCEVTKGGESSNTTVTTDFFGTARTKPLSIGAFEQDAVQCAP
jgi:hypothetical protein